MWNDENMNGLTRRDFLRVGALGVGGLSLADLAAARAVDRNKTVNCILLFLVGGPSQLDTWDLKPNAPDSIRGPFRPIKTNAPGVEICEHFPLMAQMADCYAIVRSVHHTAAPIHETGQQLMQTGYLSKGGMEYPHYGAVVSHLRGQTSEEAPAFVVLPAPIRHTGVSVSHGQTAGYLGERHEPLVLSREQLNTMTQAEKGRSRYGDNAFGQSCLGSRLLIERGVRFVTVNMFDTVFDKVTWDCHADGGSLSASINDYKESLCPMFDRAYTALLEDLRQRGMLDTTLVVATGEFGRTPRLNRRGGRDHWTGCWSMLFAGAGVRGGQIVGVSDKISAEAKDRPVTPAEVAATIYRAMGVDLAARLPGLDGGSTPITDAAPILELFRG
jgi:uncharacterized protein (DUF1501 family)